jgi:hypothetical protein
MVATTSPDGHGGPTRRTAGRCGSPRGEVVLPAQVVVPVDSVPWWPASRAPRTPPAAATPRRGRRRRPRASRTGWFTAVGATPAAVVNRRNRDSSSLRVQASSGESSSTTRRTLARPGNRARRAIDAAPGPRRSPRSARRRRHASQRLGVVELTSEVAQRARHRCDPERATLALPSASRADASWSTMPRAVARRLGWVRTGAPRRGRAGGPARAPMLPCGGTGPPPPTRSWADQPTGLGLSGTDRRSRRRHGPPLEHPIVDEGAQRVAARCPPPQPGRRERSRTGGHLGQPLLSSPLPCPEGAHCAGTATLLGGGIRHMLRLRGLERVGITPCVLHDVPPPTMFPPPPPPTRLRPGQIVTIGVSVQERGPVAAAGWGPAVDSRG